MTEDIDEIISITRGIIPTPYGPITGLAEAGIAVAVVAIGVGIFKFFSNSSVKAEGPIPSIKVGNVSGEKD